MGEGALLDDIVDSRGQDEAEVVGITGGEEEIWRDVVGRKICSFRRRGGHCGVLGHGQAGASGA